ncbi:cytochrome-c oxidase [Candidatus Endobugula sertula]|uniref:Cytochrome-c oxidase n=1 Tax=Candidatus Endobugula sertula TaxID=62101 RepID=A0A1D2QRM1_9GAMM|nr:cytochrome-c oxidase [Candidatus Endobugula sertula]
MDINDIRGLATVFMALAFGSICWWAFSSSRKKKFEEAANLPFADEEQHDKSLR